MDWGALLRSRWTWLAVAGGAVLAGVTYLARRRGGSGGGGGAPVSGEAPGYGPGGMGFYDSTATDFAQILGQYQAGTQVMLDEHRRDIEQRLAELAPDTPGAPPVQPPVSRPIPPRRTLPTPRVDTPGDLVLTVPRR